MALEADESLGRFGVLDDEGRLAPSKPVREALGLGPGASVAYVRLDRALLIIPQDEEFVTVMEQAATAWQKAGLTKEALLRQLDEIRGELMRERYGDEVVEQLARKHAKMVAARGE